MADRPYIEIGGFGINHKAGTISAKFSASAPSSMSFVIRLPYTSGLPVIGKRVDLKLRDDSKVFGGTIDQIDWSGVFESSNILEIPVKCLGYDNRLYVRSTRDRLTHICAHYKSFTGHVTTHGTTTVDWEDGDRFSPMLVGKTLVIGGANKVVSSVASPIQLTLTTTATAGTTVAYDLTIYSGQVVKDLLDHYADLEGFTYTGTSIQNGAAITELLFSPPVTIADAINAVLGLNPSFYFACDPDQVCYFATRTLVAAPSNFIDGSGPWKQAISLTETREDVRNCEVSIVNIDLIASEELVITGDGVAVAWLTTKKIGKVIKATLNGVPIDISADETSAAQLFYRQNGYEVWQNTADPPFAAGTPADEVVVEFKALDSNFDEYEDATARNARAVIEGSGFGRYEEVIDRSSSPSLTQAHQEAINSVDRLKLNYQRGTMAIRDPGYQVGMVFTLNSAKRLINTTMFIDAVTIMDFYAGIDPAEGIDFKYQLEIISLSRRITSADVMRSLFGSRGGSIGGAAFVSGGGSGGSGGGSLLVDYLLTADTSITAPVAPSDGAILTVFITENATGGWQITWGGDFQNAPIAIDTTAGAVNIIQFIGKGGKWWYQAFASS